MNQAHRKKIARTNKILVLFAVILILINAAILFNDWKKVVTHKDYKIRFTVVGNYQLGFDLNTTDLTFGKIPVGGIAERKIAIAHQIDDPLSVHIDLSGNAKRWISVSENDFILEKGDTKFVVVRVSIPENTTLGNYTSNLRVILKRT